MIVKRLLFVINVAFMVLVCYKLRSFTEDRSQLQTRYDTVIIRCDSLSQQCTQLQDAVQNIRVLSREAALVTVTMYKPTGAKTADQTPISSQKASTHRYIAISRDLYKLNGGFLNFGDYVLLSAAGNKNGIYRVKDLMDDRWSNKIDILESPNVKDYKYYSAVLTKLDWKSYLGSPISSATLN